ncbi:MAG: hypothetical protein ACLFRD_07305 [Nitriliruptoraceae bacterium]
MASEPAGSSPGACARHPWWRLRRRLRAEHGNTLVLMPVAVLILLGLGAMALDTATVFLGQRRLMDVTAAIAMDATAAVDRERFYDPDSTEVALEPVQVERRMAALLAAERGDRTLQDLSCDPPELDGPSATVTCHATVRPVLAPMWGLAEVHRLTVTETARGVRY